MGSAVGPAAGSDVRSAVGSAVGSAERAKRGEEDLDGHGASSGSTSVGIGVSGGGGGASGRAGSLRACWPPTASSGHHPLVKPSGGARGRGGSGAAAHASLRGAGLRVLMRAAARDCVRVAECCYSRADS